MAITEGQAEIKYQNSPISRITLGRNTSYHMTNTDFFSWPSNRSVRRPTPTLSGWDFDPIDLFSGRTTAINMIIQDEDLLGAMRALSTACSTGTWEGQMLDLDIWLPHDDSPKRLTGRVRDLAFPNFDRKTYSRSTECVLIFETELPYLTGISKRSNTSSLLVSSGGHVFNATFNQTFGATGSGGSFQVENSGSAATFPEFWINGPTTNPKIQSQTRNKFLKFNIVLSATDQLRINTRTSEVKLGGSASRYNTLTNDSEWFLLEPGINDLFYSSDSYHQSATLITYWYDAYLV